MRTIETKILTIVDKKHGAYWGDFVSEIDAPSKDIQLALRRLLATGVLRQKEDDQEHDWEYVRCTPTTQ